MVDIPRSERIWTWKLRTTKSPKYEHGSFLLELAKPSSENAFCPDRKHRTRRRPFIYVIYTRKIVCSCCCYHNVSVVATSALHQVTADRWIRTSMESNNQEFLYASYSINRIYLSKLAESTIRQIRQYGVIFHSPNEVQRPT